ncbi:MAG: MBL fold metallo-hydrolase, partial [Atopostipes suicloacalis]|nr:MBL fold metallo-hydrolase [Atopostipes suicloacalis]
WNKLSPIGYVLFLDVGQGDSILIKDPSTRKISLIDTGGRVSWQEKENWQKRNKNFTIGKDVVVPSIKSLGISTIDRLYISHAHADHMGEIKNIYEEIKIKEVASTLTTLEDESVKKQLSGLKEKRIVEVKENSRLDYPTPNTLAVHPGIHYNDKNNQSLVLYVKIGKDYWLFTGDLEAQGEKDLIETYPSLSANYLKVAHHGSSTSSTEEFINTIQPRNAFVSVAKKNRHNHPNPELIESFLERKMNTYLTSEDGAIKISYFKVPLVNKWSTKIERVNKD